MSRIEGHLEALRRRQVEGPHRSVRSAVGEDLALKVGTAILPGHAGGLGLVAAALGAHWDRLDEQRLRD